MILLLQEWRVNSYIFYGSKEQFESKIPKVYRTLTDLVMELDVSKMLVQIEGFEQPKKGSDKVNVENFVASSQEYAGVREHVILNFANFLAKMNVTNLYLHNPPLQISEQIKRLFPETIIESQEYKTVTEDTIREINEKFDKKIIGQATVKRQLLKGLMPLTLKDRKKPVVLLFYGSSGVGKTETAYFVSECLKEKIFRKQFSMFQNTQFSTYLFGGTHYEKSFAKDLLDRRSNVILLDEFDKSYEVFHSAFYQLFDEGVFEDQNYYVRLEKSIIICTLNYHSIEEIRKELGDAIFNRFDVVIGFNELNENAKIQIASKYIEDRKKIYEEEKSMVIPEDIILKLQNYVVRCNNVREIQHLVDDTFALCYIDYLTKNK